MTSEPEPTLLPLSTASCYRGSAPTTCSQEDRVPCPSGLQCTAKITHGEGQAAISYLPQPHVPEALFWAGMAKRMEFPLPHPAQAHKMAASLQVQRLRTLEACHPPSQLAWRVAVLCQEGKAKEIRGRHLIQCPLTDQWSHSGKNKSLSLVLLQGHRVSAQTKPGQED